jgi:hypothetical protein
LLRSGTSPGANYEEARGAESGRDFLHKLGMVLKELQEPRYWLRVVVGAGVTPNHAWEVVEKILTHLGLPVDPLRPSPARTPEWLPGVRRAADHEHDTGGYWAD